jgi:prolyl oligopeptidase
MSFDLQGYLQERRRWVDETLDQVLPPASSYPSIRRDASVVETLHGEQIADPYRWLEDPDSKETEAFVEKQNVLTASVLAQCKTRDKFKELMTELYDYPRFSGPSKQGER